MKSLSLSVLLFILAIILAGCGFAAPEEEDDGVTPPPQIPRVGCSCDLDLSAAEEVGSYAAYGSEDVTPIDGYGVYDHACDLQAASSNGQVDVSFTCRPDWRGFPPTLAYVRSTSEWWSIRRTFTSIHDLSCCEGVDFELRADEVVIRCPCSDSADSEMSSSCCYGSSSLGGDLVNEIQFRFTLADVADTTDREVLDDELWWHDFPLETLGAPFDWTTMRVPLDGFVLSEGGGSRRNDFQLDLENIIGFELNLAVITSTNGVAPCNQNGCTSLDNYGVSESGGGLSFRSVWTSCE